MKSRSRIAFLLSSVNARRFVPGMIGQVRPEVDYWMMDIYRPWKEVEKLVERWRPTVIVTELIEGITERIVGLGLPTVVAPGEFEAENVISIDVNDTAVGVLAAEHLLDLGLPHFAFLGKNTVFSVQRHRGFLQEIEKRGRAASHKLEKEPLTKQYLEHFQPPSRALVHWVRALPKPVGIFAAHDPLGRLLSECCRDLRLSIPGEVAIVSANNDELVCDLTTPPLSSVEIPWKRIGSEVIQQADRLGSGLLTGPGHLTIDPLPVRKRQSSDVIAVEDPRLAEVLQFMDREASRGINVKDVVHHFNISRRWLEKAFRQRFNRTPKDHLLLKRMDRAKRLLAHTDLTIAGVAEHAGFSSGERFAVNFKQLESITPSRYRQRFAITPKTRKGS